MKVLCGCVRGKNQKTEKRKRDWAKTAQSEKKERERIRGREGKKLTNRNRERRKGERVRSGGKEEMGWGEPVGRFDPAVPTPKFDGFRPNFRRIESRSNWKHPNSRVLHGFGEIEALPGQIGLGLSRGRPTATRGGPRGGAWPMARQCHY
ncbi:hypothetical protein ACFX13_020204 [Malus domestica]